MDDDKSLLDKLTDTVKGAAHVVAEGAKAIAHPTSGTPLDMPLNESGYALTHPNLKPKSTAEKIIKKTAKTSAKKAAKKPPKNRAAKLPPNKSKKAVKKGAKKNTKKAAKKKKARKQKR